MTKLYCIIFFEYRKIEKPKISYILEKTFVVSCICSNCKDEDVKIFKEEGSIGIVKNFGSVENM